MRFVLEHERQRTLRFATLQGSFGESLLKRHPWLRNVESLVWLEPATERGPERVFVKSDGTLKVAKYLGGVWRLSALAYLIPRRIRDAVYDFVARHRHRLAGVAPQCLAPDDHTRRRFLDENPKQLSS